MSWPAEIDVFLAVGELALYVAYLDGWPARQPVWPWATALTGFMVSTAGNVGHIQGGLGDPVSVTDRMTAATSPLAAFAGLGWANRVRWCPQTLQGRSASRLGVRNQGAPWCTPGRAASR